MNLLAFHFAIYRRHPYRFTTATNEKLLSFNLNLFVVCTGYIFTLPPVAIKNINWGLRYFCCEIGGSGTSHLSVLGPLQLLAVLPMRLPWLIWLFDLLARILWTVYAKQTLCAVLAPSWNINFDAQSGKKRTSWFFFCLRYKRSPHSPFIFILQRSSKNLYYDADQHSNSGGRCGRTHRRRYSGSAKQITKDQRRNIGINTQPRPSQRGASFRNIKFLALTLHLY